MSFGKGAPLTVAGVTLIVGFLLLPGASASEETLVIRLPLNLDGDVSADAQQAALAVRAGPSDIPRIDLMFTAAEARVLVTNFTTTETHNAPRGFDDLLNDPQGGSEQLTPDDLENAEFRINEITEQFLFLAWDGALEGAAYHATALETPARLDIEHDPQTISYRDAPRPLDFKETLERHAFDFSAKSVQYEIEGDFTFVLHGAELTTLSSQTNQLIRTGTWERSEGVDQGGISQPVQTSTTTQFVRAELQDAVLTMTVTGGDQALHAHSEQVVLDVDGSMRTGAAVGSITFNNESVRSTGQGFGATGQFRLTPTYVDENEEDKIAIFAFEGDVESLSVGPTVYGNDDGLVAVAAVGAGGILAGLGVAYLWKTGLLLPLYAKLTKAKVLDQSTRQQIHSKVEQDPGCQVKQVAESLDISWTTASYHLRVLRKMGLIVAKRSGRHEHFFAAGSAASQNHAVVAVLQNKTAKQIVETVLVNPGIIQKDLCERLGIAASTASGHLAKLRDVGALSEEREWKKRRYYAGHALQNLPIQLAGIETVRAPTTEPEAVSAS